MFVSGLIELESFPLNLSLSRSFRLEPPREKEMQQTTAATDSASKRAREQGAASGESFQSKRHFNSVKVIMDGSVNIKTV